MVQIIPQDEGLAGVLGLGLGQGLSQGLQRGLEQYHQKKSMRTGLEGLGYDKQKADKLSSLPPELMALVIKGDYAQRLNQAKAAQQQELKASQPPKLSSATTQYIKDIDKAAAPAQSVLSSANRLMELSGSTGVKGYSKHLPAPLVPADIAEFESTVNDLLSYYKAMFPRGITQQEFAILKKEALPSPTLSPEANRRRIQRFIDKAQDIVSKQEKLSQYQEQYGYVPENIRTLIEKKQEMAPEQKEAAPSQTIEKGKIIVNPKTGERMSWTGKEWKKIAG